MSSANWFVDDWAARLVSTKVARLVSLARVASRVAFTAPKATALVDTDAETCASRLVFVAEIWSATRPNVSPNKNEEFNTHTSNFGLVVFCLGDLRKH